MKTALVTGITGQDGSFLAEILLKRGYKVIGLKRRSSVINTSRVDHLYYDPNFKMRYFDLMDVGAMYRLLNEYKPDAVYHMGAQSHVAVSFEIPAVTVETNALGTLHWLEAIRNVNPKIRFYNAASSEMYGNNPLTPYDEGSQFMPVSPYAASKVFSYHITQNYRNSYGIFACNGILFNHTSPRRGETFVSRKITLGVSRIRLGLQDKLELGNLDSYRDWGYAPDYCEAIVRMMEADSPSDYVVATGETHSVREFCEKAFECAGLEYEKYVIVNSKYFRPQEVPFLLGNPQLALMHLGWTAHTGFNQLVKIMVDSDYGLIRQEVAASKEKWEMIKETKGDVDAKI